MKQLVLARSPPILANIASLWFLLYQDLYLSSISLAFCFPSLPSAGTCLNKKLSILRRMYLPFHCAVRNGTIMSMVHKRHWPSELSTCKDEGRCQVKRRLAKTLVHCHVYDTSPAPFLVAFRTNSLNLKSFYCPPKIQKNAEMWFAQFLFFIPRDFFSRAWLCTFHFCSSICLSLQNAFSLSQDVQVLVVSYLWFQSSNPCPFRVTWTPQCFSCFLIGKVVSQVIERCRILIVSNWATITLLKSHFFSILADI